MEIEIKEKSKRAFVISLFLIYILSIILIFSSFILSTASAQEQEGCCLETESERCVRTTIDKCEGRFYTGPPYDCSNVPDCKPQTCIPKEKSEPCLSNKPAAECSANGFGVPSTKPREEIEQCQTGCCIIAKGVKAEVLQKRQCEDMAETLGYDVFEFKPGINNQIECKKIGSPTDLGCCVIGAGTCSYGSRQLCTEKDGNFIPLAGGLYCADVKACALTTESYTDCGKLPGTETDIYWFDSQGNQEDLADNGNCGYPNKICTKDPITGKPECKETKCVETAEGSQKMSPNPPKVDTDDKTKKIDLLTGTSMCYNFYTHYGDNEMHERSTGLQNQILHCSFGKINVEGLGQDRKKLCVPGGEAPALIHGNVKENEFEKCSECGEAKGTLAGIKNKIGDFFGPTWGIPTGTTLAKIGDYCTKEKCEKLGDCVYHLDYGGYIKGMTPIGSCDPKYPPGAELSECSECGGGGDSLWNLCTKKECYSLGDCKFEKATEWTKSWKGVFYSVALAWAERTPLIIPDCFFACILGEAEILGIPLGPAGYLACLPKCVGDRLGSYTLSMPIAIGKGLVVDFGRKFLVDMVLTPVKQEMKSALGKA